MQKPILDNLFDPKTGEHFAKLNLKSGEVFSSKVKGSPLIGFIRDGKVFLFPDNELGSLLAI